jgi:HEPN domain-containing protein
MHNTTIIKENNKEVCDNNHYLPWLINSHRLWSLEDMLKIAASHYITIGQYLQAITQILKQTGDADEPLMGKGLDSLKSFLSLLKDECDNLKLTISAPLLADHIQRMSPAQGANAAYVHGQLSTLMKVVSKELNAQLFLYIPTSRSIYYQWGEHFSTQLIDSYPNASKELINAGKCYSVGEYTACVFHSMRAAEIGLRSLAVHLNVTFFYEITLAQWKEIIEKIEKQIKAQEQLPKSEARDKELKFCSDAASQFRHFKNAYRIFVAHARESFEEEQALSIMERTKEFVESLSVNLMEELLSL